MDGRQTDLERAPFSSIFCATAKHVYIALGRRLEQAAAAVFLISIFSDGASMITYSVSIFLFLFDVVFLLHFSLAVSHDRQIKHIYTYIGWSNITLNKQASHQTHFAVCMGTVTAYSQILFFITVMSSLSSSVSGGGWVGSLFYLYPISRVSYERREVKLTHEAFLCLRNHFFLFVLAVLLYTWANDTKANFFSGG